MFPKRGADPKPVTKVSLVTGVSDLGCGVGYYPEYLVTPPGNLPGGVRSVSMNARDFGYGVRSARIRQCLRHIETSLFFETVRG